MQVQRVEVGTDAGVTGSTGPNDAAMAAAVDAAAANGGAPPAPANTDQGRPAWLPEKFKSPEEMAKAYGELEKKLGGQQPPPADKPAAPPAPDQATKALEGAGLKIEDFNAEFQKDGKLSDGSYDKLAKAGISKEMVDGYIAGQKAIGEQVGKQMLAAGHEAAGGEGEFKAIQEWAAANATDADLKAYNDLIATQDPAKVSAAVRNLRALRDTAEGRPAAREVHGDGAARAESYQSWEQVRADMAKPEYNRDPAFRQRVQDRLANSKAL